jgi:hypothetical protein
MKTPRDWHLIGSRFASHVLCYSYGGVELFLLAEIVFDLEEETWLYRFGGMDRVQKVEECQRLQV